MTWLYMLLVVIGCVVAFAVIELLALLYVIKRYGSAIYRIFETKPLFAAHSVKPQPDGEEVELFPASNRKISGTYFRHTNQQRRGVLLFCHEFTANRWLFEPYIGSLREDGFDIFTFDFCNHGSSDSIENYETLQWVTSHEVSDVTAAIDYLKSRPDSSPNGIGVFGVSKGGGAAIAAAAKDRFVRAVVTDGAFPTHSMVTDYTMRWCVIYVHLKSVYKILPRFFWSLLTIGVVWVMNRRHNVHYIHLESKIRKLAGRGLLMINGEKDNYIPPSIAKRLYSYAAEPKELWIVEKAKHNGCLDVDPVLYRSKIRKFFLAQFPELAPVPAKSEQSAPAEQRTKEQPEKILTPGVPVG